jgi:hypothetical protein
VEKGTNEGPPHDKPDEPFWQNWEFYTALGTIILGAATICLAVKTDALVKSAERTAQKQLRAYVLPFGAIEMEDARIGSVISANITLKNTGQTPAHKTRVWGGAIYVPHPVPADFHDLPPTDDVLKPNFVLGPGGEHRAVCGTAAPLSREQLQGLKSGTHIILLVGGAIYEDAFGVEQRMGFRLVHDNHSIVPDEIGNFSTQNEK